jgi:hypothetical protein
VIEFVVAPLLHNNDPVNDSAVKVEVAQSSITVIVGGSTTAFNGVATSLPSALTHPFIICVTEYVPAVVTVIDAVVAPLLHNNDPVNPDAVNTELPHLFTTLTDGAGGVAFGELVPLPTALTQPSTV